MFVTLAQAGLMLQRRHLVIAALQVQEVYTVVQMEVAVAVVVVHIVTPAILIIIQVKCVALIVHPIIIRAHMELAVLAAMHHARMWVIVVPGGPDIKKLQHYNFY